MPPTTEQYLDHHLERRIQLDHEMYINNKLDLPLTVILRPHKAVLVVDILQTAGELFLLYGAIIGFFETAAKGIEIVVKLAKNMPKTVKTIWELVKAVRCIYSVVTTPGKTAELPEKLASLFKQFMETLEGDAVVKKVEPHSVANIINTPFWSSIFKLKLSAWANFIGARMLTLEVMTIGEPFDVVSFSTNSNYSWMITREGAILTKEGTYDVPDSTIQKETNNWTEPKQAYGHEGGRYDLTPLEKWDSVQTKGRSRRILDMNQAPGSQNQTKADEDDDIAKELTHRRREVEGAKGEEVPKVVPWSHMPPIVL
ncbi:hypothetical protein HGRIS_008514 [Hohenbuehelia grisea]|uniref:Uncharacterized protein n=1 Tax=Hohenbuehelia grisea TaxID=104357 RepID=A0ABR3J8P1_9AGAR